MAGKQAKALSEEHLQEALEYVEQHTHHPLRNRVMFLLSHKAGLRAKEISALQWTMVTDEKGNLLDVLELPDSATKGHSGRTIPLHRDLQTVLTLLNRITRPQAENHIIRSSRSESMTAASVVNWFWYLYRRLGFDRCSSHSGRRTFITKAARKISEAGGSLRDVQQLAGHANLTTTQRYIEGSDQAKRKVVDLI
ncbi:MAG: hypothetical protein NPIRA02_36320 [Nitrospirales bacterium]|nr:MAG: hypothetical protein NPIRA02_36320 [Nitrospirales bacterium]